LGGLSPSERAQVAWRYQPALQKRLRLLARLGEMSPAEIFHRIGRIGGKHGARRRGDDERLPSPLTAAAALLPPALAQRPSAYLRERQTAVGLFTIEERTRLARMARAALPAEVERTILEANVIVRDGIELLGKSFQPALPDFDWLADPERGRLWPLTAMDDADAVRRVAADVKFVWEVNRHQFLATLARAHVYGADDEIGRACVAMVRRWIESNPPGIGVNWSSNLEIAVRSISWVWCIQFLVGTSVLGDDDLRYWLASLRQHRDHLVQHLSTYTDPTNHLIGEAAALAILSIWLPELDDSLHCRELALSTLTDAVLFQVAEDGIDIEQATSYQRFVLDLVLQVLAFADRNGIEVSGQLRARASAMLEAVEVLVGPGHRMPRIGDSDDARGLPFFTIDPWDFGELLAAGDAVLGDSNGPRGNRPLTESALWLGRGLRPPIESVPNEPNAHRQPKLLSQGGYAVLPSRERPDDDRLVFDCGPLGYLPHCSHGHGDLLSVLVNVGRAEFLVDPGTYAYYDEQGRRDEFRSTRMHNTIEIGGRDQADAFDPFKWLNVPPTGFEMWHAAHSFHYVEAWHDGYQRLAQPVRHRRGVLTLAGGWLLVDWLEGEASHRVDRWFHAGPHTKVTRVESNLARIDHELTDSSLLICDLGYHATLEIGTAPYSEQYGRMSEEPALRFSESAKLPAVRMTLLSVRRPAMTGPAPALRTVRTEADDDGTALWVELCDSEGRRLHVVARTQDATETVGELRTDARVAVVTAGPEEGGAETDELMLSGGTTVERKR